MRFSMAAASCVVLAALIAGCSNSSQGTSSLPSTGGVTNTTAGGPHMFTQFEKGPITPQRMMKLYQSGKVLGPMPPGPQMDKFANAYLTRGSHHFTTAHPDAGKVAIWVDDLGYGEVLGQTKAGNVNVATIEPSSNGCDQGYSVRTVSKKLWVACSETFVGSTYNEAGAAQEYSETGSYLGGTIGGCPSNIPASECQVFYGYGLDSFSNTKDVFASDEFIENGYDCQYFYYYYNGNEYKYYGCYDYGLYTGWEYWPKSNLSAQPTAILLPYDGYIANNSWLLFYVSYGDVDNNGNIYSYFYGCNTSETVCGTGVLEVANATGASPTVTVPIAPGSLAGTYYWGGVYVSKKGKVLNVTDPYDQSTYQYALPLPASGATPFHTIGPDSGCSYSQPFFGGFSKGDKDFAEGDIDCDTLDLTVVKSNKTKYVTDSSFIEPSDAAYVKADK
jgi:hypothetical protein